MLTLEYTLLYISEGEIHPYTVSQCHITIKERIKQKINIHCETAQIDLLYMKLFSTLQPAHTFIQRFLINVWQMGTFMLMNMADTIVSWHAQSHPHGGIMATACCCTEGHAVVQPTVQKRKSHFQMSTSPWCISHACIMCAEFGVRGKNGWLKNTRDIPWLFVPDNHIDQGWKSTPVCFGSLCVVPLSEQMQWPKLSTGRRCLTCCD